MHRREIEIIETEIRAGTSLTEASSSKEIVQPSSLKTDQSNPHGVPEFRSTETASETEELETVDPKIPPHSSFLFQDLLGPFIIGESTLFEHTMSHRASASDVDTFAWKARLVAHMYLDRRPGIQGSP
jgi:hypothetical protein